MLIDAQCGLVAHTQRLDSGALQQFFDGTSTAHEAKLITDCFNEGVACANGFGATPCCAPFTCLPAGGVPIPNVSGSCRTGKDSEQRLFATKLGNRHTLLK